MHLQRLQRLFQTSRSAQGLMHGRPPFRSRAAKHLGCFQLCAQREPPLEKDLSCRVLILKRHKGNPQCF